jgi:hypothetical protein
MKEPLTLRDIEGDVCDLTRMARLAQFQLHEAVGELDVEGDKYTEVPNVEAVGLAVFVVDQMAEMTKRFEEQYYRLFNSATDDQYRAVGLDLGLIRLG